MAPTRRPSARADDETVAGDPPAAGADAGGRVLRRRADLPARLLELLSLDLLPVIPGKGSVGASGRPRQLAHLAQPLIGEGRLRSPAIRRTGARPARCCASTGSNR